MEAINQLQLAVDAYSVQKSIAETRSARVKIEKIFVDSPQHLVVHPLVDMDAQLSTELLRLEALLPKVEELHDQALLAWCIGVLCWNLRIDVG